MFGARRGPALGSEPASKDAHRMSLKSVRPPVSTESVLSISSNMADYSEAEISDMFESLLDALLMEPQAREKACNQPMEKKWQMIQMQKDLVKDTKTRWGDQQNSLLAVLRSTKTPEVQLLVRLRTQLSTRNREFLSAFIDAGGIDVLVKCIDDRICRTPVTELDAILLAELLGCCKSVMNNAIGMQAFINTAGSVERIARSLLFDWKPIALLVLEILSVCCYFSEEATQMVIMGMKVLAKTRMEMPFSMLCQAISHEDIELKAAVGQFVNRMIMEVGSVQARTALRSELSAVLYSENYERALATVSQDISALQSSDSKLSAAGGGPDAGSECHGEGSLEGVRGHRQHLKSVRYTAGIMAALPTIRESVSTQGANKSGEMVVSSGKHTVTVCPSAGTMAGNCIAAKNSERRMVEMFGAKRTKHRWYVLSCPVGTLLLYVSNFCDQV